MQVNWGALDQQDGEESERVETLKNSWGKKKETLLEGKLVMSLSTVVM